MGNINVKLYEILSSGLGDVVLRYFCKSIGSPLFSGAEPFVKFRYRVT